MLTSRLSANYRKNTIYFQNDYLVIYLDEENKLAKAEWHGFLTGEDLRMASMVGLKLIREKRLKYWIADNRKMKVIKKQDQEWIVNELGPKIAQTSLIKMATIISEDIFNQMAIKSIFTKGAQYIRFEHQYFKEEETALRWIKQQSEHESNFLLKV